MSDNSKIGPTFNSFMNLVADQLIDSENKKKVMEHFVDPIMLEITMPIQKYLTIFFVLLILILILQSINTYVILQSYK